MKKIIFLIFSITIGYSSAAFADGSCDSVLREEMSAWQSKTGFFKIRGTNLIGESLTARENAMTLFKETIDEMDLEQCSADILDDIWVLKYHLNNYFAANDEMLKMKGEIEEVDEISDLEQGTKEKYRTLFTERAVAQGTFVATLSSVFSQLDIRLEFE
ncbi:hypothetical protein EYS14_24315 [Alteromonadaceae bacterium M269]|nr:hypothetical protein EYS14_24315 [Alteromonadaceae bacterium M269]